MPSEDLMGNRSLGRHQENTEQESCSTLRPKAGMTLYALFTWCCVEIVGDEFLFFNRTGMKITFMLFSTE